MLSQYFPLFVCCGFALLFYTVDRYRIRCAKRRNSDGQCALCCVHLNWTNYEEVAIGGGELFRTKARICMRCARREKRITWFVVMVIVALFVAALVVLKL